MSRWKPDEISGWKVLSVTPRQCGTPCYATRSSTSGRKPLEQQAALDADGHLIPPDTITRSVPMSGWHPEKPGVRPSRRFQTAVPPSPSARDLRNAPTQKRRLSGSFFQSSTSIRSQPCRKATGLILYDSRTSYIHRMMDQGRGRRDKLDSDSIPLF